MFAFKVLRFDLVQHFENRVVLDPRILLADDQVRNKEEIEVLAVKNAVLLDQRNEICKHLIVGLSSAVLLVDHSLNVHNFARARRIRQQSEDIVDRFFVS